MHYVSSHYSHQRALLPPTFSRRIDAQFLQLATGIGGEQRRQADFKRGFGLFLLIVTLLGCVMSKRLMQRKATADVEAAFAT